MTTLRPYQQLGLAEAVAAAARPGSRTLWAAPTGTGKGTLQLAALAAIPGAALTTPSGEIARGFLDRLGAADPGEALGESELWRRAEAARIYSPVRLRNRLRAGTIAPPTAILADEAHHISQASGVWDAILAACPGAPVLGWTATPYRGSHAETEALRAWWGEPRVLLTIAAAADAGYLSIPAPAGWPLLDDAGARLARDGEYDPEDVGRLAREQGVFAALAARLASAGWCAPANGVPARWSRPTLVAVASVALAKEGAAALTAAGLPAAAVSGSTPRAERDALLARCRAGELALVQVQVLAEGVDLPWLRRLVDLRPLRSPVAWMQLLGRCTRPVGPDEPPPEYVCACRNLERHAYLLGDRWPARRLAQEEAAAFGGGAPRGGPLDRGLAWDALRGRRVYAVPLRGGGAAQVVHLRRVAVSSHDPHLAWDRQEEVLAVGVPGEATPRTFVRSVTSDASGRRIWGRWQPTTLDAAGYAGWEAGKPWPLSEKQRAWWERAAAERGLDPAAAAELTAREFAVLPALCDARATLAVDRLIDVAPAPGGPPAASACDAPMPAVPAPGPAPLSTPRVEPDAAAPAAAADLAARLRAAEAAATEARPLPATWAKLHSGEWGARLAGEAARVVLPGATLLVRSRDGREAERTVAAIAARSANGADALAWALVELAAQPVATADPRLAGRYAIEHDVLRFVLIGRDGRLWEQAGPTLHPVAPARAGALLAAIEADPGAACARYGRELGVCGRCGRALTDAASRASGIGPVCAERGW